MVTARVLALTEKALLRPWQKKSANARRTVQHPQRIPPMAAAALCLVSPVWRS